MKRHFPGLHAEAARANDFLEGIFLVRVDRAYYRWHPQKPFFILSFTVLEPEEFASRKISGQLYCTEKSLWRLNWFLRDFGYDTGQVVGFSQDANGDISSTVAWIWQDGVMKDPNTLIPADSRLFLVEALGINDHGEISGFAFDATGVDAPAFVATPCDGDHTNAEGCEDPDVGKARERPNLVLPENIRQLLSQRLSGRYHIPAPRAPRN